MILGIVGLVLRTITVCGAAPALDVVPIAEQLTSHGRHRLFNSVSRDTMRRKVQVADCECLTL
jgi:hypothetical protein